MQGNLVTVMKNNMLINIDETELCQNDIVVFQSGDIVPADLRIIETAGLEVDEFGLTGEITPVIKNVQDNAMLYQGSKIIKGSGKGIVVATGEQTEYGKILKQAWEQNGSYTFRFIKKQYLIMVALLLPPFAIWVIQSQRPVLFIFIYLLLSGILILIQTMNFIGIYLLRAK